MTALHTSLARAQSLLVFSLIALALPIFAATLSADEPVVETQASLHPTSNDATPPANELTVPLDRSGLRLDSLLGSLASWQSIDLQPHWLTEVAGVRIPQQYVDLADGLTGGLIEQHWSPDGSQLVVDLDRVERRRRQTSSAWRERLANSHDWSPSELVYVTDDGQTSSAQLKRLVVVVPGLQSSHEGAVEVARCVHERTQLPTAAWRYPNDAPIAESGARFAKTIAELSCAHPELRIDVVAHSMGCLVARWALEASPQAPQLQVERLIMFGPPNHGSLLAEYAAPLEALDLVARARNRQSGDQGLLLQAMLDGLGEARLDLKPDSRLLRVLDACRRNPAVHYTILAGNRAPLNGASSFLLGQAWRKLASKSEGLQAINTRVSALTGSDELRAGKGDGFVSIASMRLAGVNDFQVVPYSHLEWCDFSSTRTAELWSAVSERLAK